MFGVDFTDTVNLGAADFTGAFYDATTVIDGTIVDLAIMIFVPEPNSGSLLLLGLALLAQARRRRSRRT